MLRLENNWKIFGIGWGILGRMYWKCWRRMLGDSHWLDWGLSGDCRRLTGDSQWY